MHFRDVLTPIGNKHDWLVGILDHLGKTIHIDVLHIRNILGVSHGHSEGKVFQGIHQPGKLRNIFQDTSAA